MSATSPYRDLRQEFFQKYFESGLTYKDYLATGTADQQAKWKSFAEGLEITADQKSRVSKFVRTMPVLVMSGIWCGDCARQGPMLALIEGLNPLLQFRYLDNKQNPELQDELRINGAEKVPVIVSFSEDFYELSRFGDRHLSVYHRKVETELGAACDPGLFAPKDELAAELEEWISHFERLQAIVRLAPMLRKRHGD